jgi:hypothetical protein
MDEHLRISLWMVSGGGLGAILGSAFGALTAALYWQHGGSAGTGLGRRVADALARTAEDEPSPFRRAILTGAADGFLFLGVVGLLAGTAIAVTGAAPQALIPVALGSALLVGAAAFFGTLAYALTRLGLWAILLLFAGGLLGSFLAGVLLGADRCLLGTIPGLILGLALAFTTRHYAPTFRPPRVDPSLPRNRPDAETDITRTPPARSDADSFRKPDAFEEG